LKTYNYSKLNLPAFSLRALRKLTNRSAFTILILLFQQSLFAQNKVIETNPDAYSNFIVVLVILLISSIFIGLEILGDPKYESQNNFRYNNPEVMSTPLIGSGYVFEKNLTSKLTIALYSAGLLVVIYAVLVFLMF
jgi:hypothetical protein